jgi:two-component system NtrC family response regulator
MSQEGLRTFDQLPSDSLSACPVVLIVDDDAVWRKLAREICEGSLDGGRVEVIECESIAIALSALAKKRAHVVVLDKNLGPDQENSQHNGVASIPRLLALQSHLNIIMATSSEDRADIVEALQNGACNFVVKQKDPAFFMHTVRIAIRNAVLALHAEAASGKGGAQASNGEIQLLGSSLAIMLLRSRLTEMAKADAAVLFLGPTGAGKTTAAKYLHHQRGIFFKLPKRPFVHLNMGAVPEDTAEGELFGAEAGSYTDAKRLKIGLFEQADGGTLFLDEIAEASLNLQKKLLTVLEEGRFRRLGGKQEISSQFRLICATNQDLRQLVREKKFREDLYRRISVIEVQIPSLEERREDIEDILRSIFPQCCKDARVFIDFEELPKDFIRNLTVNLPEGNIRGLHHKVTRLLVFAPKDRRGRPLLKQWRSVRELDQADTPELAPIPDRALTWKELLDRPLDGTGDPGFPGVKRFLEAIEQKVYEDARRKYGSAYGSNRHIAEALKLTDTAVGLRLRHFKLERRTNTVRPSPRTGL